MFNIRPETAETSSEQGLIFLFLYNTHHGVGSRCGGSSSLCGFNKARLEKSTVTGHSRGTVVEGGGRSKAGDLALNAEVTGSEHWPHTRFKGTEREQSPARLIQGCSTGNCGSAFRGASCGRRPAVRSHLPPGRPCARSGAAPRLQFGAGIGVAGGRRRTLRASQTPVEAVRL